MKFLKNSTLYVTIKNVDKIKISIGVYVSKKCVYVFKNVSLYHHPKINKNKKKFNIMYFDNLPTYLFEYYFTNFDKKNNQNCKKKTIILLIKYRVYANVFNK